MEYQPTETTTAQLHCPACSQPITEEDFFCQHCGFPIKAPAEERDAFIRNRNHKSLELAEMQRKIKNASTSIYVIAGFSALLAIISFFTTAEELNPIAVGLVNLVVAGLFCGLGFWCRKQPVAAIISALSLYIILWIASAIDNPLNLLSGIIIKVIIIGYLIKGLNSAFEAQKIKKAHSL